MILEKPAHIDSGLAFRLKIFRQTDDFDKLPVLGFDTPALG